MVKKKAVAVIAVLILAIVVIYMIQPVKVIEIKGNVSIFPTAGGIIIFQVPELPVNVQKSATYEIKEIPRASYMVDKRRPRVTESHPQDIDMNVVNLTIKFLLIVPSANKTVEFEPLRLREGGSHKFSLILGPDEGVTSGTFKLIIKFWLLVTTPAGATIGPIELTPIELEFEIP